MEVFGDRLIFIEAKNMCRKNMILNEVLSKLEKEIIEKHGEGSVKDFPTYEESIKKALSKRIVTA